MITKVEVTHYNSFIMKVDIIVATQIMTILAIITPKFILIIRVIIQKTNALIIYI